MAQLLMTRLLDRSDAIPVPARYNFLDVFERHDACRSVVKL